MKPREFFPLMPDEVFNMWLVPFIEDKSIGWPFTENDTDISKTRWKYLLGIDRTLEDWMQCEWNLIELNLSQIQIAGSSVAMLRGIIIHCTTGAPTETANLQNTKERFRACADYIQQHGVIPKPIIATISGNIAEVIDGHHRLAALAHHGIPTNYLIPAWVPQLNEPNK